MNAVDQPCSRGAAAGKYASSAVSCGVECPNAWIQVAVALQAPRPSAARVPGVDSTASVSARRAASASSAPSVAFVQAGLQPAPELLGARVSAWASALSNVNVMVGTRAGRGAASSGAGGGSPSWHAAGGGRTPRVPGTTQVGSAPRRGHGSIRCKRFSDRSPPGLRRPPSPPREPVVSEAVRAMAADPANDLFLSAVSAWEITIKHGLGRLPLPESPDAWVSDRRRRMGIDSLALNEAAATHVAKLPALHRDPFDRALVAQAIVGGLTLLTPDESVRAYPALTLW